MSLLRPFGRDQKSGFARGDGLAGRVGALIASEGELPWKPELDSGLNRLRNVKANTSLGAFARVYVQRVLAEHEPDLVVRSVTATREADGRVTVRVESGEVKINTVVG